MTHREILVEIGLEDSIVFEKNKQIVNRDRCSVWVKIVYDKAYVQREYKQDKRAFFHEGILLVLWDLGNVRAAALEPA